MGINLIALSHRFHIKVIGCMYTLVSRDHQGGITLGLVDLIGHHFVSHHRIRSLKELYPTLLIIRVWYLYMVLQHNHKLEINLKRC